jgi:hypothetical protein
MTGMSQATARVGNATIQISQFTLPPPITSMSYCTKRMLLVLDDDDASDYVRGIKQKPSEEAPKQTEGESDTDFQERQTQWKADTKEYNRQNKKARSKIGLLVEDGPFKHIEDLDDHLESWNTLKKVYRIRDVTLPILYLGQMSDCRLETCKNMTEYTSRMKDMLQQINSSSGDSVQLGEWAAVGFLLKNLTGTYSQWSTVKYDALRNNEKPPTLEDLIRELITEEHRIQASSVTSDANFAKKDDKKSGMQRKPAGNHPMTLRSVGSNIQSSSQTG